MWSGLGAVICCHFALNVHLMANLTVGTDYFIPVNWRDRFDSARNAGFSPNLGRPQDLEVYRT